MNTKNEFGEWAFTTHGQPVIDNVPLHHECEGASDYCVHCGVDMTTDLGNDPCRSLEQARRNQINPDTVIAFGCSMEATHGMTPCKKWCQGINCPYTRRTTNED